MTKRAIATNWEILTRDAEGAAVNIDFDCPCCSYSTGVFIIVGASGVDFLDGSWETDQVCPICDENLVIECH